MPGAGFDDPANKGGNYEEQEPKVILSNQRLP